MNAFFSFETIQILTTSAVAILALLAGLAGLKFARGAATQESAAKATAYAALALFADYVVKYGPQAYDVVASWV